jgi:ADP-dependent NAD(P)H-hydrate dehydratase / NAD(P)H-hydrate epimerase
MKIFSASQIKAWDAFTIEQEPIISTDLMERAATACFHWLIRHYEPAQSFAIFCGKGNNGGDGMAIARLLSGAGYHVFVYVVETYSKGSADFEINLSRFQQTGAVNFLTGETVFPGLQNTIVIDALFGTGLNKRPTGVFSRLIQYLNENASSIISIDVPSGMYIDKSTCRQKPGQKAANETVALDQSVRADCVVINASVTLTFQNQKLAFLMPENELYNGKVVLLDIQLSKEFEKQNNTPFIFVDKELIAGIYHPRKSFSNKGNFGYASLLAGSYGMMGAAVLSSLACLRSGVGKLTTCTCADGYDIIQTAVPEAMCKTYGNKHLEKVKGIKDFDVIGIGPGIGRYDSHVKLLEKVFKKFRKPVVLDADALNVLSENQSLYKNIPAGSVLTPHPKEFERLFGKTDSDFDTIRLALSKAQELNVYIVLKGHYTFIAIPDNKGFFNSTGNAGMATAGSGDVLTGIITGLLAQKYSSADACILGVYLHGLAGDLAAQAVSQEALIAKDIIDYLGKAFKEVAEISL